MSSNSGTCNSSDLNFFQNLKQSGGNHRYLICPKCHGYYPLRRNESPDDFLECECGSDLEFYENIDDFIMELKNLEDNSEVLYDEGNDLQEIENVLKSKSEMRKEFFKELSKRIKVQEDLLSNLNYNEGRFLDALGETSLQGNMGGPSIVTENTQLQEDNFLSYIKKQRSRAERAENNYFIKIGTVLFIIAVAMLLVLVLR